MHPIDEDALEIYVLANAPEYVADMKASEQDVREGKTESMDKVFVDIDQGS